MKKNSLGFKILVAGAAIISIAGTVSAFIVGGSVAAKDTLPWTVALVRSSDGVHICGGTLIKENWVVTAAHCVTYWQGATTPDSIDAVIGRHDLKTSEGERIKLNQIIVHENYIGWKENTNQKYDIALLELKTASTKKPITLISPENEPYYIKNGTYLIFAICLSSFC